MESVLRNMANHLLIEYCLAKGIDCSGTVTIKPGRGFTYHLSKQDKDGNITHSVARITFHKNSVPTYGWN